MKVIIEKRKPRSYKLKDSFYDNAMKVAKRHKTTLSEVIEKFVIQYSKIKNTESPHAYYFNNPCKDC